MVMASWNVSVWRALVHTARENMMWYGFGVGTGGAAFRESAGVSVDQPTWFGVVVQAWKPPIRSVVRWSPRSWSRAAARLEA